MDLNAYYDSRELLVLTVNTLGKLGYGMEYFSLVNYLSPVGEGAADQAASVYTEQNFRWQPAPDVPLAASLQWVLQAPNPSSLSRLGPLWKVSSTPYIDAAFRWLHLRFSVTWHAIQINTIDNHGWQWQLEYVYRWDIAPELLDRRLHVAGFADQNLWSTGSNRTYDAKFVTEHQLGIRLVGELYAVGEFRINDFLPEDEQTGFGGGLEYVIVFPARD